MNKEDLEQFLEFAHYHNMMKRPVTEVLQCWSEYIRETLEEEWADMYNSTIEAHELPYI